ncbi:Cytokinin dehydrogenase 3 [Apostasia shenzhenica]|uniref:cytokinin dehydrogenase n=1 Tax=Apostasia shenzhenica TaxID=1088818 RepID=A0A2H9ZY66_9ASPA|nr:Cytokinin dehydrogenase 3 [Apostasia shenzhenica]
MALAKFSVRFNALLLAFAICSPCKFIQSPMDIGPFSLSSTASMDFGKFLFNSPSIVMRPKSPMDISVLLTFLSTSSSSSSSGMISVAARGSGHSIHGQAQAPDGIVIEMDSLPSAIEIHKIKDEEDGFSYADVSGGALWAELLEHSLKVGLAPRSWTDYLYLSIGGTLSNAGISGQTFKYGPQISNVLQLEVVTGKGEIIICSPTQNSDLFYAVLGGLGQFGIITRARILLQDAPQKVKWIRAFYDDFRAFTNDQELLISMPEKVDYVEGFIVLNKNSLHSSSMAFPAQMDFITELRKESNKAYYCLEFAVHDYQTEETATEQVVMEIISRLNFIPSFNNSVEVSYYDFLNRVRMEEISLRGRGLWDVPHPWLNIFVPKSAIEDFKDLLWDANTSAVLPETSPRVAAADKEEKGVFFVVGVLQSADPSKCDAACAAEILRRQQQVAEIAGGELFGAKQYLGHQPSPAHWRKHFGRRWDRFADRKSRFDPLALLAPGQGIFPKTPSTSVK